MLNHEAAAQHLARNIHLKVYIETEGERTIRIYKLLITYGASSSNLPTKDDGWLSLACNKDGPTLQIFHCKEDILWFETLSQFGEEFHHTPAFTMRWVRAHLHGKVGGVSELALPMYFNSTKFLQMILKAFQHMSQMTLGVFASNDHFVMRDPPMWEAYKKLLKAGPLEEHEMDHATRVWQGIAQSSANRNCIDAYWTTTLTNEEGKVVPFIEVLDKVTEDLVGVGGFHTPGLLWQAKLTEYLADVRLHIRKAICQPAHVDNRMVVLAKNILPVYAWTTFNHGDAYCQLPLPFVTPSVIPALASSLEQVDDAVTEVSATFYYQRQSVGLKGDGDVCTPAPRVRLKRGGYRQGERLLYRPSGRPEGRHCR